MPSGKSFNFSAHGVQVSHDGATGTTSFNVTDPERAINDAKALADKLAPQKHEGIKQGIMRFTDDKIADAILAGNNVRDHGTGALDRGLG